MKWLSCVLSLFSLFSFAAGVGDHYLEFSGKSGDYVSCPSFSFLNERGKATLEGWFYLEKVELGTSLVFCGDKDGAYVDVGLSESYRGALAVSLISKSHKVLGVSKVTVNAGNWNHVAVVYDGAVVGDNKYNSSRVKCYVNGLEVTLDFKENDDERSSAVPPLTPALKRVLNIGSSNGKFAFKGRIAELRVWNRALDQKTIALWKNRSVGKEHPFCRDLVLYYDMKTPEGSVLADVCGKHPADFKGEMSIKSIVTTVTSANDIVRSMAKDDPDYIVFNRDVELGYKVTEQSRDPFKKFSRSRSYKAGELRPEEILAVKKELESYKLLGAVKGRGNSKDICLFDKGKFTIGETFVVEIGDKKVDVLVYKLKENPIGVILKVGAENIVKLIERK